jgi:ABC-type spermidine/putrescine transport system permease subunit II
MMQDFFASGRVADLVLLVLLAEATALFLWHRRTGRGLAPLALAGLVLPGVAFALALRAALTGAGWHWVAAALVAAFLAHGFDVAVRMRTRG